DALSPRQRHYGSVSLCLVQGLTLCVFSSRRRHTRSKRDWSSDVCSSDLDQIKSTIVEVEESQQIELQAVVVAASSGLIVSGKWRSEERRVGKEGGPRRRGLHQRRTLWVDVSETEGSAKARGQ